MLLGVNAYSNNAGMALFDGEIALVQEEERFNRKKKTHDFPHLSLDNAAPDGFGSDIEAVCFPWDPRRFIRTYMRVLADEFPQSFQLLLPASSREDNSMLPVRAMFRMRGHLRKHFDVKVPEVHFVEHHKAHAAVAFYGSGFDDALILVADAFGDKCSVSAFVGEGDHIDEIHQNRLMDSLGVLYSCVTAHLGYLTVLDEGKVMALASYGTDAFVDEFKQIIKPLPGGEIEFDYSWLNYHRAGEIRPFTRKFEEAFGPARKAGEPIEQRHKDLARALQATVEEALLHLVAGLKEQSGKRNLAYAGGVAMNCVAAGRLARELGFEAMYIPPCPDDGGVQLGAAMWHHCMTLGRPRGAAIDAASLGAEYGESEIDSAIGGRRHVSVDDPAEEAAALIEQGKVVGWFQGRMEAGPRALGNRSILADPRRGEMQDHLNAKVKHREMYRPYAPSVLDEAVKEWYPDSPYSPFMSFTSTVRADRAERVPAVTHVDGTARVQSVRADVAPLYHRLISSFARRTGVPLVLNTSLNDKEPI
ncbi:MAG: carbamoyltransferase, partial [Thermoleophilaceae bacterium]